MGFASGLVSFRRLAVVGQHPRQIKQDLLDKLEEFALQIGEYGIPDEVEYGWCGGRHVLDGAFSFEHNVFADAVQFAMRIDTNRVPSELRKAYQMMEEDAAAAQNPSGFASKAQKREARDNVRQRLEKELKSGKFRRSKLVPVLWDFPAQVIYSPVSSSAIEKMQELFERTFELKLEPLTAGALGARQLQQKGKRRDYEDLRPTRFCAGPEGEGQRPDYPWVAKGPQPKDFLGNEFLLWLWHEIDVRGGSFKADGAGDVNVVIDKSLELDCAYGQSGSDALRGSGPTQMLEARDALRSGKVPRRCGMIVETAGKQFEFGFNPEAFACSSARLPDVEDAEDARVMFEERIAMLRDLVKAMDGLFQVFLNARASSAWENHTSGIRRWIMQTGKHAAVA